MGMGSIEIYDTHDKHRDAIKKNTHTQNQRQMQCLKIWEPRDKHIQCIIVFRNQNVYSEMTAFVRFTYSQNIKSHAKHSSVRGQPDKKKEKSGGTPPPVPEDVSPRNPIWKDDRHPSVRTNESVCNCSVNTVIFFAGIACD